MYTCACSLNRSSSSAASCSCWFLAAKEAHAATPPPPHPNLCRPVLAPSHPTPKRTYTNMHMLASGHPAHMHTHSSGFTTHICGKQICLERINTPTYAPVPAPSAAPVHQLPAAAAGSWQPGRLMPQPTPHHTPSQTCTYGDLHMLTHGKMRTQSSTQHHTDLLEAVMSQKYPTHPRIPVPAPSAAPVHQLPAAAVGSWQPGRLVPQPKPHCCCPPWPRVHAGGASGTRALRVKVQGEPNRGRGGGVFRKGRSQGGVRRRGR